MITHLEPLWKIEETLEALVDSMDTCEPELEQELAEKITAYLAVSKTKVDAVAAVLTSFEQMTENAKAEMERLRARQERAQRARERLEGYVLHVIRERGGGPLQGHNVTLSARRSERLVIDDASSIPMEFKRTTLVVDIPKDAIKRAIKRGEPVAGAHIEPHDHLQRR